MNPNGDKAAFRQSLQVFVRITLARMLAPMPDIEGGEHVVEARPMAKMSGVVPVVVGLRDNLDQLGVTQDMLEKLVLLIGITLNSPMFNLNWMIHERRMFDCCDTVGDIVEKVMECLGREPDSIDLAYEPGDEFFRFSGQSSASNDELRKPWERLAFLLAFMVGLGALVYIVGLLTKG
jgi:hypothetical protein